MFWSGWTAGPEAGNAGDVFVSVMRFQVIRRIDMPRIIWSGWRLKRRWGELPGAVGTWLWVDLSARCVGSVSLWRGEADMRHFVRWQPHAEIVRRNRQAGHILSTSWSAAARDARAIRADAVRWLASVNPATATGG